ncbi:MAG TPA: LuxR family transcriptional regulator [Alphaproteobacteria bacterium]|nr:LuxR family transcriptional regulator [Alphaproteobacteria bacterium]
MLVDSHCHLNFPDLKNRHDEVIESARKAGVGIMQTICTKMSEFDEVYAIADKYENVYASIGVHPHEADHDQPDVKLLKTLSKWPKVIGIGETGLDYYYKNAAPENQKENFEKHLIVAADEGLPVIVHTRDAEDDTYNILSEQMSRKPFTGLLHCFTGSAEMAQKCMELGMYISISGIVTFKNAIILQEIVRDVIPLNRLLVETDSPFLAPVPHRGKPCEPAFTRNTAEFIASLKGISYEELAKETTENFLTLFNKAQLTS